MINYIVGDGRDALAKIPDGSVDLVASSPPFFALRSYLQDGHDDKHAEMGSERTPAEYLDNLLEVTALWARVLAPHGSIVIELGDTYAGSGGAGGDYNDGGMRDGQQAFDGSAAGGRRKDHEESGRLPRQRAKPKTASRTGQTTVDAAPPDRLRTRRRLPGFPQAKSMILIPQLFEVALAYGINPLTGKKSPAGSWLVRNVIVWHRPNPTVGALGDKVRPSTSYITVATRLGARWYDLTAARTALTEPAPRHSGLRRQAPERHGQRETGGPMIVQNPAGAPPQDAWFDEYDGSTDLWTMTPQPSRLAHYAMWPAKLAERLVLMMCPPAVCTICGKPSSRLESKTRVRLHDGELEPPRVPPTRDDAVNGSTAIGMRHGMGVKIETLGWSDCGHDSYRPGMVLDPFAGTGTTLCVAELHGRDSIGIDIDARNRELLEPRMAECKRSLFGTKVELPGQLTLI